MTLPPVPEPFAWTRTAAGPLLRCEPLARLAPHGFTTRHVQLTREGGRSLAGALGADALVTVRQVHGRDVLVLRQDERRSTGPSAACTLTGDAPAGEAHVPDVPAADVPAADVIVSNDPAVAIAVRAADCVPVLVADAASGAVAAVHAGWRGLAAGALPAAIAALTRQFGTDPADCHAAIGPHIGACCYEVGAELIDRFAEAGHPRPLVHRWFTRVSGSLRLDLGLVARDHLAAAGVPAAHTCSAALCTAMHLEALTSFRAEREKAGRIAGVIRARG